MGSNIMDRSAFKHNFLKQIIVRLDFQGVLQAEMENVLLQVKAYLKDKQFNRYEQKISNEIDLNINNSIFQVDNPIKEIRNVTIHSFTNENSGYAIDLSTNFILLKVNATKYIPFESYSTIFMDIANIYKSTIDFFTVKRFGLRKINFCFLDNVNCVNKYFSKRYFDCCDLFEGLDIFASEKKQNFAVDKCKVNLLCGIEQGQLGDRRIYKVTLDSDIYVDTTENVEQIIFTDNDIVKLNDKLFEIYKDVLTEEFIKMLLDEDVSWSGEIMGVDKNE